MDEFWFLTTLKCWTNLVPCDVAAKELGGSVVQECSKEVAKPPEIRLVFENGGKFPALLCNNDGVATWHRSNIKTLGYECDDRLIGSAEDLSHLATIGYRAEGAFPRGWKVVLSVDPSHAVRVFERREALAPQYFGKDARDPEKHVSEAGGSFLLDEAPLEWDFGVEAVRYPDPSFDGRVRFTLDLLDDKKKPVSTQSVGVHVAPWLMANHLDPVTRVFVVRRLDSKPPRSGQKGTQYVPNTISDSFVNALATVVPSLDVVDIETNKLWLRDVAVGGYSYHSDPANALPCMLRSPTVVGADLETISMFGFGKPSSPFDIHGADALLDALRVRYRGRGAGFVSAVTPDYARSDLDSGGNFICSPPVTKYPFGAIIHGTASDRPPRSDFLEFMEAQRCQPLLAVDTSWLMVGHVDEVLTFIPWPSSKLGFKLVLASAALGYKLLAESGKALLDVPPGYAEKKQAEAEVEGLTAGEVAASTVIQMAMKIAEKALEGIRTLLTKALSLTEDDIIELPVVFYRHQVTDKPKQVKLSTSTKKTEFRSGLAAFLPSAVNMLVVTKPDGKATLCIPKPYGPRSSPFEPDLFETVITDRLAGSGNTIAFIDDFAALHVDVGEIHCGTYEVRVPRVKGPSWWEGR